VGPVAEATAPAEAGRDAGVHSPQRKGARMLTLVQILVWAHGLSGAAWFGAIAYRTFAVDRKVGEYFPDRADFERFSVHLAHNMRYPVWIGLLTCAASGSVLMGLRWQPASGVWLGLMAAKVVVWMIACGLFCYVSYVFWPARSLAAPGEFAGYRRQNFTLSVGMVLLAALGFLLGQSCRLS
jgi:hypothetical protein